LAKTKGGLISNGRLLLGSEFLDGGAVFSQIGLGSDQNERNVGAVVRNFGIPLGLQVLEGGRVDNGIGQQENIGTKAVIILNHETRCVALVPS
jgi:hypothetical protein